MVLCGLCPDFSVMHFKDEKKSAQASPDHISSSQMDTNLLRDSS